MEERIGERARTKPHGGERRRTEPLGDYVRLTFKKSGQTNWPISTGGGRGAGLIPMERIARMPGIA